MGNSIQIRINIKGTLLYVCVRISKLNAKITDISFTKHCYPLFFNSICLPSGNSLTSWKHRQFGQFFVLVVLALPIQCNAFLFLAQPQTSCLLLESRNCKTCLLMNPCGSLPLPLYTNMGNANVWRKIYEQVVRCGGLARGESRHKTLFINMPGADSKQQPFKTWTPRRTANMNRGRQREHNANMSHAK